MKKVKIEFLEAIRFNLNQEMADMDITKTDKESGIRSVNINTIKWLIFNGVKYIVE